MIEKFYYLFYKEVKTTRKNDQSFFNAFIGLCFIEFMNLGSVFSIVNHFLKYRVQENVAVIVAVGVFAIAIACNYFVIWVIKEKIIFKYQNSPTKYGKAIFWGLIIFSFALCFFVLEYFV